MERWRDDEPDAEEADEEALEDEYGGDWELDPNDPSHPDHDLSESSGYAYWDEPPKPFYLRQGFIAFVSVLVILGLMLPVLARVL